MAILAMHSAATGLNAFSTSMDVIAHNIANINTDGFKASRTNFQDLLYQQKAQPGVENLNGDERPTGLFIGLGTKISGTQLNFEQGALKPTDRQLDIAIDGQGFFQVEVDDELGEGLAYTRAGNFTLNSDGEIVLITDEGRRLSPSITVPENATGIEIQADGTVAVTTSGSNDLQQIGNIELAQFVNPAGLRQIGENLYLPSPASGEAQLGEPIEGGRGRLIQGSLESSNVDPVLELVSLIKTQRAFELNSQTIQAADEVLRSVGQLRSF